MSRDQKKKVVAWGIYWEDDGRLVTSGSRCLLYRTRREAIAELRRCGYFGANFVRLEGVAVLRGTTEKEGEEK